MELRTVTEVDQATARRRFHEYRAAVKERHSDEDAAIMAGYRELARGRPLISLREAVETGGLNDQGLPHLAVARATARWCYVGFERHSWSDPADGWDVTFSESAQAPSSAKHCVRRIRRVFAGDETSRRPWGMRAMVPLIPPALRPARGLGRYHVLWEVERWERAPRPPGDPALLRQVDGDLYSVVATWDLTDLERLVLAGRSEE